LSNPAFFSKLAFLTAALLLFPGTGAAERIFLNNGMVIEGEIVSREKSYIQVKHLGLTVPYLVSEIARIESDAGAAAGYKNERCGFFIRWPEGWEMHEVEIGGLLLYAYVSGPFTGAPRIYVSAWKDDVTLKETAEKVIKDMLARNQINALRSGERPSASSVVVNGFPAETFSADIDAMEDPWDKMKINNARIKSYLFDSGGIKILFDFVYHKDSRMEAEWMILEETLNSVQFIRGKNDAR